MKNFENKHFKLVKNNAISKSGDSAIMLDLKSGIYFELNEVGLLIVDNLSSFKSFEEINELIIENFDVDKEQCKLDLNLFLNDLYERYLIEVQKID
tara:strand:- start:355 stop:642 length:288 start_codon:yes stop_codon:yes gene_type:complete